MNDILADLTNYEDIDIRFNEFVEDKVYKLLLDFRTIAQSPYNRNKNDYIVFKGYFLESHEVPFVTKDILYSNIHFSKRTFEIAFKQYLKKEKIDREELREILGKSWVTVHFKRISMKKMNISFLQLKHGGGV